MMTNKNQIALMGTLNELVEMAKEISSKKWFINSDEEVTAIDNDAGPDDSEEAFIGCAANIQLAKYIAAASPEAILAIAEATEDCIGELTQFKAAFDAWHSKTEWVQTDRRFDVLMPWGMHRADVLRHYIERQDTRIAELEEQKNKSGEHFYKAVQYGAKLESELSKLKGDAVPFMYAICHPDGSAWMDEGCVALDQSHLGVVLADLRRDTGEDYHIVPVFTQAQPVPVVVLPKSERLDGNGYGYYLDMHDVFTALEAAGINFKSDDGEGE